MDIFTGEVTGFEVGNVGDAFKGIIVGLRVGLVVGLSGIGTSAGDETGIEVGLEVGPSETPESIQHKDSAEHPSLK